MFSPTRRSLAKGAAWSIPTLAVAAAAPAVAASPCAATATSVETITFGAGSRVYSDAPVPGSFTAGKFELINTTAYALPPGYHFTITFTVITPPSNVGATSGYQSYISTTNAADQPLKFSTTPATNAKVGSPGVGGATLNQALAPGASLTGTWSGSPVSADFENAAAMRYTVTIAAPTQTYTYTDSATNACGTTTTTTHTTTVMGGSWTYNNGGTGV